jgi:hypothetical protein
MKRRVRALIAGLIVLLPTVALADSGGCPWPFPTFSSFAGVALVGVSVGLILFSRRP